MLSLKSSTIKHLAKGVASHSWGFVGQSVGQSVRAGGRKDHRNPLPSAHNDFPHSSTSVVPHGSCSYAGEGLSRALLLALPP